LFIFYALKLSSLFMSSLINAKSSGNADIFKTPLCLRVIPDF